MAYRNLWGAYALACQRFGVDPGPRGGVSALSGFGSASTGQGSKGLSTPSLTRAFLEAGSMTDGLGWFAELGAQIRRDIVERHGLETLVRRPAPDTPPNFQDYFAGKRLRPSCI